MKKIFLLLIVPWCQAERNSCKLYNPFPLTPADYQQHCEKEVEKLKKSQTEDEQMTNQEALKKCEENFCSQQRWQNFKRCQKECDDKEYCAYLSGNSTCFVCNICTREHPTKPGMLEVKHRDAVLGCYEDETIESTYVAYGPCPNERSYKKDCGKD